MSIVCEISRTDIYDYQIALIKPFFKCILIHLYSLCIYPVVPAALAYKIPCTSGAIHTVAGLLCILCHRKRGCLCIMLQIQYNHRKCSRTAAARRKIIATVLFIAPSLIPLLQKRYCILRSLCSQINIMLYRMLLRILIYEVNCLIIFLGKLL